MSIWKNVEPQGYELKSGPLAPALQDFAPLSGLQLYAFTDSGDVNEIFCRFEIPHDYKAGTDLRPHIHWSPSISTSGNVEWSLDLIIGDDDTPFLSCCGHKAVDAVVSADVYHSCEFSPFIPGSVSGHTIQPGAIMLARLYRDSGADSDTYDGDARLLSFGIHYQAYAQGSTSVFAYAGG